MYENGPVLVGQVEVARSS